jgi:hypothetical protein
MPTAPGAGEGGRAVPGIAAVRVTRSRHPLQGKALPVLGRMRRHGRVELLVVLPDGSKTLFPAAWTDLDATAADTPPGQVDGGAGSPTATVGALDDLAQAVAVASALLARARAVDEQAARQPPCKEDSRAACATESDTRDGPGATAAGHRGTPRTAAGRSPRGAGPADRQGRRPGPGRGREAGGQ